MMMRRSWRDFWTRDEAAVTVDMVVLMSAVVGLCIGIVYVLWQGAYEMTVNVATAVETLDIDRYIEGQK